MQLPLILNELSYEGWVPDEYEAKERLKLFAQVLKGIVVIRRDAFLLSKVRLADIVLSNGDPVSKYAADPGMKEEILFLFSVANRSPFSVEGAVDVDGSECHFEGRSGIGLLYCVLLSGVAVSFSSDRAWRSATLRVRLSQMSDDSGHLEVVEDDRVLPNVSDITHIENHKELLLTLGVVLPENAGELWRQRDELFPNLDFLPGVERQLTALGSATEALRQVGSRLRELQLATQDWDVAVQLFPTWRSHVTPEGETRKELARFTDAEGRSHLFDLHARYTPGAGRIHFRLLRSSGRLEVAYIGEKL